MYAIDAFFPPEHPLSEDPQPTPEPPLRPTKRNQEVQNIQCTQSAPMHLTMQAPDPPCTKFDGLVRKPKPNQIAARRSGMEKKYILHPSHSAHFGEKLTRYTRRSTGYLPEEFKLFEGTNMTMSARERKSGGRGKAESGSGAKGRSNRSESVDVVRHRIMNNAWWMLKQSDIDAIRRARHSSPKTQPPPSTPSTGSPSTHHSTQPTTARPRLRQSPLLVKRKSQYNLNKSQTLPHHLSLLPGPQLEESVERVGDEGRHLNAKSDLMVSKQIRHPSRREMHSAAPALWQDLKHVDKMYQHKLIREQSRGSGFNGTLGIEQLAPRRRYYASESDLSGWKRSVRSKADGMPLGHTMPRKNGSPRARNGNERRRFTFWKETVIPSWETVVDSEVVRRIWDQHGVPASLRRYVWPLALGCSDKQGWKEESFEKCLETEMAPSKGVGGKEDDQTGAELGALSFGLARRASITQDLSRMSDLRDDHSSAMKSRLEQVLLAFCAHRPGVTYVQGMSYLVKVLLSYMGREKAFRCLCCLLDCDYFHAYLDMDAHLIRLRFQIFQDLLSLNLPKLKRYFCSMGLVPDCYLMEWLMCLHSKQLSIKAASRVWDGYLIHGEMYVFRVSIAILSLLQPKLINKQLNQCVKILRSNFYHIEQEALVNAARLVRIPREISQRLHSSLPLTP
ncbi:hypothetical protein AAMO2058_000274200 [Amorphochlora amoebiformis]